MSSGFISEAELAERRKIRQEEWDKVRTADQPAEVSEEKVDHRSLYDRLQEQKNKKDMEYEEAHKLKNMIKGLDDDEVEFLDLVDRTKLEEERKKHLEEQEEMREFKARVATLQEESLNERLKQELKKPQSTSKTTSGGSGRNSQHQLLAGVVVKKQETSPTDSSKGSKRKLSDTDWSANTETTQNGTTLSPKMHHPSAFKCIGILPGLGFYNDSSDSECNSESEPETGRPKYDILGRKIAIPDEDK